MTDQGQDSIPEYTDIPIGIDAVGTRSEFDRLGTVEVPADKYWGAQTQRSLQHFSIGKDHMPIEVYRAYGLVKNGCALVNERAGRVDHYVATSAMLDSTLRDAALVSGKLTAEQFDSVVKPHDMVGDGIAGA
ncbi:fumarate hydratase class II [Mycolicibacterium sp. BK634]|uniref:lyase family protein n=1 Tax=Mycolicibacterium sp. BK634 TaxID=2587099 RepID=UPI0017C4B240|nr:lyase family protein [Mycolicibacterium sp. BK634]MBB3751575.1 fumarate hydratase class II [Mycolicibacterium sp. BK634]